MKPTSVEPLGLSLQAPAAKKGMAVKSAFTLVELLVVITIIIVLLTLLMPAMEEAAYQARLAACMGKLRVIGGGSTHYAMDHANWYPYNPSHDKNFNWLSTMLRINRSGSDPLGELPLDAPATGLETPDVTFDMRPTLHPWMPLNKTMVDPLMHQPVDLEQTNADAIHGSYALRMGWTWRYTHDGVRNGEDGAFKLYQKFSWSYDWDQQRPAHHRFSVIASDYDWVNPDARSSHPDRKNIMWIWRLEDAAGSSGTQTKALWIGDRRPERGEVDTNYAYQDGSVQRFTGVTRRDERMVRVPIYNRGNHRAGDLDPISSIVENIPKE